MINIDNNEILKPDLKPDIALNVDVKIFLQEINKYNSIHSTHLVGSEWLNQCQYFKGQNKFFMKIDKSKKINSYYVIEKLNELTNTRHIFVNDAGSGNYVCSQSLELKEGQRELTSGAFYSMGIALPMSIGAACSYPDHQIVAIIGDGSIELNIQELRTLSLNNLNVKLFIINNGGYASIRKSQDDMVGGRYTDDEEVLDFRLVARAFGLQYRLFDSYQALDEGFHKIFKTNVPELIEVICDSDQQILEPFTTSLNP